MNEKAQLDAMAAELEAAGYEVRRDILGSELGLDLPAQSPLREITLDLVGKLGDATGEADERPSLIVIEVANRTRPITRGGRITFRRTFAEDEDAVLRFKTISMGISQHRSIGFEIRFFDISADQSAARRIDRGFRTKQNIIERVQEDQRLLDRSVAWDELSRALVVARLWARWLRLAGNLHPGRKHREFKAADLRTIQKDLFDQDLLLMQPSVYGELHRSLLAVVEGGDFEPRDLLTLEPELRKLLHWAAQRYNATTPGEEPKAED